MSHPFKNIPFVVSKRISRCPLHTKEGQWRQGTNSLPRWREVGSKLPRVLRFECPSLSISISHSMPVGITSAGPRPSLSFLDGNGTRIARPVFIQKTLRNETLGNPTTTTQSTTKNTKPSTIAAPYQKHVIISKDRKKRHIQCKSTSNNDTKQP